MKVGVKCAILVTSVMWTILVSAAETDQVTAVHTVTREGPADWTSTIPATESYGTVDTSILAVGAWSFDPYNSESIGLTDGSLGLRYCTSQCTLAASFFLPSGVKITGFELVAYDASVTLQASAEIIRCQDNGFTCDLLAGLSTGEANDPGSTVVSQSANHTVQNNGGFYWAAVGMDGSNLIALVGIRVYYRRQISPAPGVATFSDVPTGHSFFPGIEALAASGITGGCGGGKYCPNDPVTRGQMATFLARALGLHWEN